MTFSDQKTSSGASAVLVAAGTVLPPDWHLESDSVAGGWSRLADTQDFRTAENKLNATGWTFFFMATPLTAQAWGFDRQGMLNTALARLVATVTLQKCNCVQIDGISERRFLGIPCVRVSAHPRHIQKGMQFSGGTE